MVLKFSKRNTVEPSKQFYEPSHKLLLLQYGPCSPIFTWFAWCWQCQRGCGHLRISATWPSCEPRPLFHQTATPIRTLLVRTFGATASRRARPPLKGTLAPRTRARRRSENSARFQAPRPSCHRSRKCRCGWRAGVGGARHRSRKLAGLLGGAAAATLKRNVEVSLGREEGRRRMLGESDGRRANAGTGRLGSPPGVSVLFPPGLFAGSRALR